jgi:predicted transposase YbfD/YdcC
MAQDRLQEEFLYDEVGITSFVEELKMHLPDTRDNRGKRHGIVFVTVCFLLATLSGRHKLSSIHRFIVNRLDWLRTITTIADAKLISRAHLPRLLDSVDWVALDKIINRCFGVRIEQNSDKKWIAVDGKALRGSQSGDDRQSIVLAVNQGTRETVGQARQTGTKSSEIPVVRALLKDTGLESQNVSLDAHHCNPETTAQIHQAKGIYLVQVKENQAVLLQQCEQLAATQTAMAERDVNDKANGRVTSRRTTFFSLAQTTIAPRWQASGLTTLVVITRETFQVSRQKTTMDTSYYISNQTIRSDDIASSDDLAQAIQGHWSVESNNWIRDVTFCEDKIKVKAGNQGQIMARLRGLAIELIRKTGIKNLQAAVERFIDSPLYLELMLRQVNFL